MKLTQQERAVLIDALHNTKKEVTPTPSSGLLPDCPWCGKAPYRNETWAQCETDGCPLRNIDMSIKKWCARRAAGEMPDLTELMIALLVEARVGAALLELKATPTSTDQAKRIRAAIAAVESLYPRAGNGGKDE